MFEARLAQGTLLKKLVDAVKDLVTDVNFDVSNTGLACQVGEGSSNGGCYRRPKPCVEPLGATRA